MSPPVPHPTITHSANSSTSLSSAWDAIRGRSQFVVNVLTNAGGSTLNSVLQLLLLLALGRLLGKETYAAWFAVGPLIAIGEVGCDFGTRLWAVKRFAGSEDAALTFRYCVWNKVLFTLLAVIVLSLIPLNALTLSSLVLSVLIATTQPSSDPFLWYLRGKERLDVEAGVVLSCRVAIVAGLVATALFDVQLVQLLLVWLLSNVVRMIWESRLEICSPLFARSGTAAVSLRDLKKNVRDVLPIGVSLVLAPMFTQCAVLFVAVYGTASHLTEFGAAFRLAMAAGFVGTSIVVSSFARLSRAIADNDDVAARKIVRTKFLLLTAAFTPICIFGMLMSVPVAELVSQLTMKPDLATAGRVMVLLMPGLYLSTINMGAKFSLNAFGLNRQDVVAMLTGFLTLVVVFHAASEFALPVRAALCWMSGEAAVLTCRLSFLKAQNRLEGVPVWLIGGTVAGLAALATSLYVYA